MIASFTDRLIGLLCGLTLTLAVITVHRMITSIWDEFKGELAKLRAIRLRDVIVERDEARAALERAQGLLTIAEDHTTVLKLAVINARADSSELARLIETIPPGDLATHLSTMVSLLHVALQEADRATGDSTAS